MDNRVGIDWGSRAGGRGKGEQLGTTGELRDWGIGTTVIEQQLKKERKGKEAAWWLLDHFISLRFSNIFSVDLLICIV